MNARDGLAPEPGNGTDQAAWLAAEGENLSADPGTPPEGDPTTAEPQVLTVTRHEIEVAIAERTYQVTGANLRRLNDFAVTLKLTAFTQGGERRFFLSDLNLARSRSRSDFALEAGEMFLMSEELLKADLLALIGVLERLQRENIARLDEERAVVKKTFTLREGEEAQAIAYLGQRDLFHDCLLKDLDRMGYVGDETGKQVLFLAATSRKFQQPVSVLSVANSAAGKSFAQETILSLIPDDEVLAFTRLSPMSLSHFGRNDLRHRLINIDELSGIDPVEAMYQLRSLISRGLLTAGFTSIDRQTGRMETLHKEVLGPVAVMTSTTHEELIDDETRSRFLILTTPETPAQTEKVLSSMVRAHTREGILLQRERERLRRKHQALQKVIRPLEILVPQEWAEKLSFSANRIAYKRRFRGYLSLMFTLALLRQYQRQVQVETDAAGKPFEFIHLEKVDVEDANALMQELYGEAAPDLSPVNRKMLQDIEAHCRRQAEATQLKPHEIPFSRRDLREAKGWEETPAKRAFEALEQLEYIRRAYGIESGRSRWFYKLLAPVEQAGGGMKLWAP